MDEADRTAECLNSITIGSLRNAVTRA
jgi:hypothetical protein